MKEDQFTIHRVGLMRLVQCFDQALLSESLSCVVGSGKRAASSEARECEEK